MTNYAGWINVLIMTAFSGIVLLILSGLFRLHYILKRKNKIPTSNNPSNKEN